MLSKIKWEWGFLESKWLFLNKVLWPLELRLPWANYAVQEPSNQKDRGILGSAPPGMLGFRGYEETLVLPSQFMIAYLDKMLSKKKPILDRCDV